MTSRTHRFRAASLATLVLSLAAASASACSSSDGDSAERGVETPRAPDGAPNAPPEAGTSSDAGRSPEADAAPCTWTTLKQRLACIPGITVVEEVVNDPEAGVTVVPEGYRRFELLIVQPANHDDPKSATFKQRLSLLHKSETGPMVLSSSGYGLSTGRSEVTRTFTSNQLSVEHRFFTPSVPMPPTWKDLDIRQSAADYHRIVTALKSVYTGHWVNTGASKGGMTSVYHRRFYPQDLNGTVAYVAPNVYGTDDPRFVTFLQQVGGPDYAACRAKLQEVQKAALANRAAMVALMKGSYTMLGGKEIALEHAVLELPFVFWQYTPPDNAQVGCAAIPAADAPVADIFQFVDAAASFSNYADPDFEQFAPYYYQAATQLGAPGVDDAPLAGLLQHRATYAAASYAPKGVPITFDAAAMVDIAAWVKTSAETTMFVYGEYDPWSAGAFELGAAKDSFLFVAAGRNHGAKLTGLTAAEKVTALDALERWMGAKATPPPAFGGGPRDFVAGDDDLAHRPRL